MYRYTIFAWVRPANAPVGSATYPTNFCLEVDPRHNVAQAALQALKAVGLVAPAGLTKVC